MHEVAARQGPEEFRKENVLLLNKADLVSLEQRKFWASYFAEKGIEFIFFSAIEEQERIEDYRTKQESNEEIEETDQSESEEKSVEPANEMPKNPWDIYNVDQLKVYFKERRKGKFRQNSEHLTIGMVGYPNVGKSSTINVLIADKKVSVSATPGKTKVEAKTFNFLTLIIVALSNVVLRRGQRNYALRLSWVGFSVASNGQRRIGSGWYFAFQSHS